MTMLFVKADVNICSLVQMFVIIVNEVLAQWVKWSGDEGSSSAET